MRHDTDKSEHLIGTTTAARMLNLSVGTVQNLVNLGELPAYRTNGGHRRIPYNSVVEYIHSTQMNFKNSNGFHSDFEIYVMHDGSGLDHGDLSSANKEFIISSDPIELLAMTAHDKYIFIDARIQWIDWTHLNKFEALSIHCAIYNSEHLKAEALKELNKSILLFNGPISNEFLKGFKMALQFSHGRLKNGVQHTAIDSHMA